MCYTRTGNRYVLSTLVCASRFLRTRIFEKSKQHADKVIDVGPRKSDPRTFCTIRRSPVSPGYAESTLQSQQDKRYFRPPSGGGCYLRPMSISYERCEYRDEKVTTSFSDQLVEQEMSTDGREDQHAFDSSSDDSPSRKRHLEPYDDNALNVKDDVLENEAIGTKRQKVDVANSRKPNTDQWDSMFLRLAAYKAEKGVSLLINTKGTRKKPILNMHYTGLSSSKAIRA